MKKNRNILKAIFLFSSSLLTTTMVACSGGVNLNSSIKDENPNKNNSDTTPDTPKENKDKNQTSPEVNKTDKDKEVKPKDPVVGNTNNESNKTDSKEPTSTEKLEVLEELGPLPIRAPVSAPPVTSVPNTPFDPSNPQLPPGFPGMLDRVNGFYRDKMPTTTLPKKNDSELYDAIYKRTFAVSFVTNDVDANDNKITKLSSMNEGTTWLFDYYKYKQVNKYKLFFATNLHVASAIRNTLENNKTELFDYSDDVKSSDGKLSSTLGLNLGRSKVSNRNFSSHNDKTSLGAFSEAAKFYTNIQNDSGSAKNEAMLTPPKMVFAATGFMNDEDEKGYINKLKEKAKNYEITDENAKKIIRDNYQKATYYKDFVVFEIDVDLTKDNSDSKEFSSWIQEAINSFENIKSYTKNNDVPNHDRGDIPYVSYDYASMFHAPKRKIYKIFNNYDKANHSAEMAYILGYPKDVKQYAVRNNNSERYNTKNTWSVTSLGHTNGFGGSNVSFNSDIWNRPFANHYGFNSGLNFSSLYYGASGSMVTNEYGLPLGIYSSVNASVNSTEISKNGGYTNFVQNFDIPFYDIPNAVYSAHNLIDGSDKRLYPRQRTSYRENLRFLYPNGFENSEDSKKTAIFDKNY
ncbi:MIP family Ig-specific serine endopeptidase [Mycoplasmopsis alligatoris]|uniref:Lipofamily protein n=1 Tax=Mycoplasmopsis alligatoris A21JP2 TaxID=747682 RepID=D4XV90_9BACT|nr:DUF31 family protein [Mycoplasmopsis alligatoris]EFF41740.1 lipofamily protein [Mycoplasmopsis alligatoris A21JP2]